MRVVATPLSIQSHISGDIIAGLHRRVKSVVSHRKSIRIVRGVVYKKVVIVVVHTMQGNEVVTARRRALRIRRTRTTQRSGPMHGECLPRWKRPWTRKGQAIAGIRRRLPGSHPCKLSQQISGDLSDCWVNDAKRGLRKRCVEDGKTEAPIGRSRGKDKTTVLIQRHVGVSVFRLVRCGPFMWARFETRVVEQSMIGRHMTSYIVDVHAFGSDNARDAAAGRKPC